MLYTALIVIHVMLAVGLIAVVLVQRGAGATMGAAFGAGASGTVFGSKGSAGFLSKLTGWLGVAFFVISLSMAIMLARTGSTVSDANDLGVAERLVDTPQLVIPTELMGEDSDSVEATQDEFLAPPTGDEEASVQAQSETESEPEPKPEPDGR
jgi:preprotein translocase subunit SecG